jgi:hypothetical protein
MSRLEGNPLDAFINDGCWRFFSSEFATNDPNVCRGINRQSDAVSGDLIDDQDDVIADHQSLTHFAAKN